MDLEEIGQTSKNEFGKNPLHFGHLEGLSSLNVGHCRSTFLKDPNPKYPDQASRASETLLSMEQEFIGLYYREMTKDPKMFDFIIQGSSVHIS